MSTKQRCCPLDLDFRSYTIKWQILHLHLFHFIAVCHNSLPEPVIGYLLRFSSLISGLCLERPWLLPSKSLTVHNSLPHSTLFTTAIQIASLDNPTIIQPIASEVLRSNFQKLPTLTELGFTRRFNKLRCDKLETRITVRITYFTTSVPNWT
jgi:hypothetical protein